jgi:hypothetical protein
MTSALRAKTTAMTLPSKEPKAIQRSSLLRSDRRTRTGPSKIHRILEIDAMFGEIEIVLPLVPFERCWTRFKKTSVHH